MNLADEIEKRLNEIRVQEVEDMFGATLKGEALKSYLLQNAHHIIEALRNTQPEARRIEREIVSTAMERYRIWQEDHPEGPIPPNKEGGIRHQAGYDLILLCAEYARQLAEADKPSAMNNYSESK